MSARRTLIIIVAIAVGALAAVSTVLYVRGAQTRANRDAALVSVYVVARTIPKATTGDAALANGLVRRTTIPRRFFPATAVVNIEQIRGRLTPIELAAGQVVVNDQFVAPAAAQTTFSATIHPGMVAVTVSLPDTAAVGGLVVPGDQVDLMIIVTPLDAGGNPVKPVETSRYAHFFYQNVRVIAVGKSTAPRPGDTAPATNPGSALYTFEVPPQAAERIVLAAQGSVGGAGATQGGGLIMALVPPDNQAVSLPAVGGGTVDAPSPPVLAGPPPLSPTGS